MPKEFFGKKSCANITGLILTTYYVALGYPNLVISLITISAIIEVLTVSCLLCMYKVIRKAERNIVGSRLKEW